MEHHDFLEDQWLEKNGKGSEKAEAMLRNYARKIGDDPDLYLTEEAAQWRKEHGKEEREKEAGACIAAIVPVVIAIYVAYKLAVAGHIFGAIIGFFGVWFNLTMIILLIII